jgi:hypothetical protein
MTRPPLTEAQRIALEWIAGDRTDLPVRAHRNPLAAGTLRALTSRGFIDGWAITEAGRAALTEATSD